MYGSAALSGSPLPNQVAGPPTDSISKICWFPGVENDRTFVAAASWDKTLRVWEVIVPVNPVLNGTVNSNPKCQFTHESPILSCGFSKQGAIFAGGADGVLKMYNLATNQAQAVGKHDAGISGVFFDDQRNVAITGSWDKTIKFWDCRQPNPGMTVQLSGKVYAMDYRQEIIACATSDRGIYTLNINTPQQQPTRYETLLRLQFSALRLSPSGKGLTVGSIEGRANSIAFHSQNKDENFAFRCHREDGANKQRGKVYPVHTLDFHPNHNTTLVTGGGDGALTTWEIVKKQRVHEIAKPNKIPVVDAKFDFSGKLLACAQSYNWLKGVQGAPECTTTLLAVLQVPNSYIMTS